MATKTALLYVDDDCVKIVVGESLKIIKFNALKADHNIQLLEKLFSNCTVFTIKDLVELSKDSFVRHIGEKMEKVEEKPLAKTAAIVAVPDQKRSVPAILAEAEEESDRMLFRSTDETTIVVDDLPTGDDLPNMPGVKRTLAVVPYKAIDLSSLPEESVRNSKQLKRLIREGTLVPCTRAEAIAMQSDFDNKMRSDQDARIDTASPIISESAADFVAKTSGSGKFDMNAHDAKPIDIIDDGGEEGEMEKLMRMAGASDDEPPPDLPLPKKKSNYIPSQGSTGIKAKGINRSEKKADE